MKRIAFSLLAVFALLVCVFSISAPQAQAATDTPIQFHCKCGNKYSTALTDGEITWKENCTDVHIGDCDGEILQWTKIPIGTTALEPGNYYLFDNGTANDYITIRSSGFELTGTVAGEYNIDLNGMDFNMNGKNVRAFLVGNGSTLNVGNSKTTGGTIQSLGSANNGGVILVGKNCTLNLYGVGVQRLEGHGNVTNGGAMEISSGGKLNAYDCTITGGAATGVGGAIFSNGGTINLNNVAVVGGSVGGNGGAICAASGSLTITGGSVTGGTVTGASKNGGNLFIGAGVTTNLTDVTISEGSATNGGNIYVFNNHTGVLNVKNCIIHSGTASANGGNVWLGTAAANAEGKMELAGFSGTKIYNGTAASGGSVYTARRLNLVRSTIGYDLEGNAAGAVATDRGGNVFVNDAELLLQKESKIGYGTATNDGGNVYVTGENGNGKLTVYDQSKLQWGEAVNGGNVYLNNGNVYFGGTVDATHDTGCQIVNGQATGNGGNVYVAAGHGNAQGDALIAGGGSANTTVDGGNIYVAANASFTLKGRSIVRNGKDLPAGQQTGNIYNAGQLDVLGEAKIYGGSTITKTGERNIYCAGSGTVAVTDSVNDKDEYVVNESVIRGGLMVNGGKLVLGGSPWIKSNAVGERSLYLFNNTVVDATGLIEGADVEIFDASSTDRKIADVTAEQTWIKDAFRLSEDSTLACVITREIDAEGNVSLWLRPAIAASVETETGVYDYQTTEEAIANCDATQTIILDLKGREMALNIPGNLKLIDSANDDFTTQTGSFTGTVGGEVSSLVDANGNRYLVVENEGVYTSHRYTVGLTHISLDPNNDALGYKAELVGDDVVKAQVKTIGFNLWVNADQVLTRTVDGKTAATLRLRNILKNNGGEMTIYGNAFVTFHNEETVTSEDYGTTMKAALQMVNENWASYDQIQQTAVKTLCDQYMDTVSGWKLTNIYPEV
ncbi:MAG: hypothetical protein IKW10_05105 [Oscillospiraceae bacterium]|nr:hypothetical protein [Oscillospiraceae bacterium]